jgi:predicted RNase H-like HicB family nuclease
MRFLIMLEQTDAGFAVQVPDLAVITFGGDIEAAKRAAAEAIQINLDAYRESGRQVPDVEPVERHLENPEFRELLFAYVDVSGPTGRIAA